MTRIITVGAVTRPRRRPSLFLACRGMTTEQALDAAAEHFTARGVAWVALEARPT